MITKSHPDNNNHDDTTKNNHNRYDGDTKKNHATLATAEI